MNQKKASREGFCPFLSRFRPTCANKTTYIITECIEINVTIHQSTYYIAEDLLQSKRININELRIVGANVN